MTEPLGKASETGYISVGGWVTLSDPVAAEIMARAGFDYLVVDLQHGAIGWDGLAGVLQAVELGGTRALVRVGWNDPVQIMRALDLGATGVIVPMVSTREQASAAVAAARYPPDGIRSYGPVRGRHAPPAAPVPPPLCLVMIETEEALTHLDAVATTPGIDGLFVGPIDLALSLGLEPATPMPDRVLTAIDDVVAACRRASLIVGCASLGADNAVLLVKHGVGFVTLGSDVGLIRRGAAAELGRMRS